jgi:hypothetical protein
VTEAGPFERHGVVPDMRAVGRVTRADATRETLGFLAQNGCILAGSRWEDLPADEQELWIEAFSDFYVRAQRTASKAAMAELKAREALALALHCRKCNAQEGKACWDMRTKQRVHIAHPHQERMDDIEAEAAAS